MLWQTSEKSPLHRQRPSPLPRFRYAFNGDSATSMSMSEMVQRVAEAIADQMAADDNDNPSIARAAIAAMREPTQEMRQAFGRAGQMATFHEGYQAMIDAALEQQKAPAG